MSQDGSKVVLIAGASSGIGAAVARELGRLDHRLALTARRADRLEQVAETLLNRRDEVLIIPADLSDAEAPAAIVAAVGARFGALDVLINNAAFGLPQSFARAEPEVVRRQLLVNFVPRSS